MHTKILTTIFCLFILCGKALPQEKIHTCINEKGERLFSVKAKYIGHFEDGMAQVEKTVLENNKAYYRYGFIDYTGKQVIEAKYEKVYQFAFGVTWVKDPGAEGYYLINKKGERLTTQIWKKVGYFFEGFAAVYDNEEAMGFINRKGELIVPCKYLGSSGFTEGLACVMPYDSKEEKYGFIDTTGSIAIPFQYKQPGTSTFDNGECRVMINGVVCLINKKGEVTFKPTLTKNTDGFYNGLSSSYTNYETRGDWGYYNRKNEWVIKPQYDNANSFEGGLAVVGNAGKYGVIDTTGRIIIPIQYESLLGNPSENGYFGVERIANGTKEYLNAQGKPFTNIPIKYLYGSNGHKLLPYCNQENKYGYLNLDGSVFIDAQFESTQTFYEGKSLIKGNTTSLKIAPGINNDAFVLEYTVSEKIKSKKNGKGEYYPGTIKEIGENYYLIMFDNGDQEWVVFDSIKR